MTTLWWAILLAAVISLTIKAAGPVLLGDRTLPAWTTGVIALLAPVLLAALIVVGVLGPGWSEFSWSVLGGLGAVAAARLLRAAMPLAVGIGIVTTALLRLVG